MPGKGKAPRRKRGKSKTKPEPDLLSRLGFSSGKGGVHTARTMMLQELESLLAYVKTRKQKKRTTRGPSPRKTAWGSVRPKPGPSPSVTSLSFTPSTGHASSSGPSCSSGAATFPAGLSWRCSAPMPATPFCVPRHPLYWNTLKVQRFPVNLSKHCLMPRNPDGSARRR